MLKKKFLENNYLNILLIFFIIFLVNFSSVYFEQAYRNNTIYFPVDYGFDVKSNPFSQAEYAWGWSNGRWLGAVIESRFFFKNINSIEALQLSKLIGIFLTALSSYIVYLFQLKINNQKSNFKFALISSSLFLLPGFIYFNFMGCINSQITILIISLVGYFLYDWESLKKIFILFFFFFLCLSNYSPVCLLILIFPSLVILQKIDIRKKIQIFKKYLLFIFASFVFFYIFKTFLLESFYNIYHGSFYASEYPFFKNEHPQYKTEFNFNLKHFLKKIIIYFSVWFVNDLNLWNIYASIIIALISLLIIVKFYLIENYKKNKLEIFLIFAIYLVPIGIWFPFQTTLVPYRGIIGTQMIIFLVLTNIFINKKNFHPIFFYFIIFVSISLSTTNSYFNAKNAYIEYKFVQKKLSEINNKTKHVHVIQPTVGTSYLGQRSIELEFNRPSNLTWQETTRYLNSAFIGLKNNKKIFFHDCETNIKKKNNLIIYDMQFPTHWNLKECIKKLKDNFILVTWEHPHQFDQSNLNFMSRYNELHKGMSLDKTKYKSTLFIDLNELMNKNNN